MLVISLSFHKQSIRQIKNRVVLHLSHSWKYMIMSFM